MALKAIILFLIASILLVSTKGIDTGPSAAPKPIVTPVKPPTPAPIPINTPPSAKTPTPSPVLTPPKTVTPRPLIKSKAECGPQCDNRCSLHSRPNVCIRACTTCCQRCLCVPPGTSGNKEVCKCYANMTTKGGRSKCP